MTDKELIKDVLELLQLIVTSNHTLLPTNPPTDPWVYHKVSSKIEDMENRIRETEMTDKELIKDVLELLQLIYTSNHTLLPTNPPTDPWVYHKVSSKIEDIEERLNNKLQAETEQPTTRKSKENFRRTR